MKSKKPKEKSYLNRLLENFIVRVDIYLLYFIIAGLILQLVKSQVIGIADGFNFVPLVIYVYILIKIFWLDIPNKTEDEIKKT